MPNLPADKLLLHQATQFLEDADGQFSERVGQRACSLSACPSMMSMAPAQPLMACSAGGVLRHGEPWALDP